MSYLLGLVTPHEFPTWTPEANSTLKQLTLRQQGALPTTAQVHRDKERDDPIYVLNFQEVPKSHRRLIHKFVLEVSPYAEEVGDDVDSCKTSGPSSVVLIRFVRVSASLRSTKFQHVTNQRCPHSAPGFGMVSHAVHRYDYPGPLQRSRSRDGLVLLQHIAKA